MKALRTKAGYGNYKMNKASYNKIRVRDLGGYYAYKPQNTRLFLFQCPSGDVFRIGWNHSRAWLFYRASGKGAGINQVTQIKMLVQ